MKTLKFMAALAAAILSLQACEETGTGAGDATVSFEKTEYTFAENAGSVSIPLVFTGEPKEYPIILNISASVAEGGVSIGDAVNFVQQIGSLRYNGNGTLAIEMEIKDNYMQNDNVVLTLEIVSADGAEIVGGTTTVTITDNDGSLFDTLQGRWIFDTMQDDQVPFRFEVYIIDGETDEEAAENEAQNRLCCIGFGGYGYSPDDYSIPFKWYLDIVTDETTGTQSLRTVPGVLIEHPGNPFVDASGNPEGDFTQVRIYLWFQGLRTNDLDPSTTVSATISDDLNTITFDPDYRFVPYIFDDGLAWGAWADLYDCRMTRD